MGEEGSKELRVNIWFHKGNTEEEEAFGYIRQRKKEGIPYAQYISMCVLEHEKRNRTIFRQEEMNALAELIAGKLRGNQEAAGNKNWFDIS